LRESSSPSFPDNPLLGMFVGRTVRQLILFCGLRPSALEVSDHGEGGRGRAISFNRDQGTTQFMTFARDWADNPISALAWAAHCDDRAPALARAFAGDGRSVLDAICHVVLQRFLETERQRAPMPAAMEEAADRLFSASVAQCFNAFNAEILRPSFSQDYPASAIMQPEDASALIWELATDHPLLSELLGYWYPLGDRQRYFFSSVFDYISDYSEYPTAG